MACRTVGSSDSVDRTSLIAIGMRPWSATRAYGFDKLLKILRRWGHGWNRKRIHRLYCELDLNQQR